MDDETEVLDALIEKDDDEEEVARKSAEYQGELRPATEEEADRYEKLWLLDREGKKFHVGQRHAQLVQYAAKLQKLGTDPVIIKQKLKFFDDKYNDPAKKDPGEIENIVRWARENIRQGLPANRAQEPLDLESEFTDFGNARRMLKMHQGNILFIAERKTWMTWDNSEGKWTPDNKAVVELTKEMIRKIKIEAMDAYAMAKSTDDPDEQENLEKKGKALLSWWAMSQKPARIKACLDVLSTDPAVATSTSAFDTHINLFNFKNGTMNLDTMTFYPHNKDDRITMSCGHNYDPGATCPHWDAFTERIFLNHPEKKELKNYTQCALGLSLSGDISEQKVQMPVGAGGNGKSVLAGGMRIAFGDYAATIASTSLTTASQNKVRNDLACLAGCRILFASEVPEGSTLDDHLIKNITGGEPIKVRFLYEEEFEFKPELKLWWSFNKTPATKDMSKGLWDRIRTIPFNERIRDTPEDVKMEILLEGFRQEASGILNWLIEGYVHYRKNGKLPVCNAVTERTAEYKDESDPLFSFFEDNLDVWKPEEHLNEPMPKDFVVTAGDAFNAYQWHALRDGVKRPMTSTKFGITMKDKIGRENFDKRKDANYYLGIKLKRDKRNLPDFEDRFHN